MDGVDEVGDLEFWRGWFFGVVFQLGQLVS